jgi:hypothetical protein
MNIPVSGRDVYFIRPTQPVNHTLERVVLLGRQNTYYFYTPVFPWESLIVHYHPGVPSIAKVYLFKERVIT